MGLVLLAVGAIIYLAIRGNRRPTSRPQPKRPAPRQPHPKSRDRTADVVGGWMLGHQLAKGHHGFPGDPLPGGHLGAPQDLAFWGGIFDEDAEESDRE